MIEEKPPQAMSLFDLIGRAWDLGQPVKQLGFNANGSAVACGLKDGALALLPVADGEHPEKRIRMELDSGRTSIRPRENPLPQPTAVDAQMAADGPDFCPLGEQGFAFARTNGEVWRVTARGQALRLVSGGAPVTALCALPGSDALVVARGRNLQLVAATTGEGTVAAALPGDIARMALSPDGGRLIVWGEGGFTLLSADRLEVQSAFDCPSPALSLEWSADGRWIAAGGGDNSLILIDTGAGRLDRIVDFPAAVHSAGFSLKGAALLASGAFRVVGWRGPDLPFGDHAGEPIETGKPGLTVVERIAPHPQKDLCAAAYGNGLVTICQIGRREELMLAEGGGEPVTAMAWSPDGAHLAFACADGRAAIATFPKAMFK
ncbi:MAG: WD40 repeat domain-containing protein [Paracoccus sp. (in: a-proteobacteria)]